MNQRGHDDERCVCLTKGCYELKRLFLHELKPLYFTRFKGSFTERLSLAVLYITLPSCNLVMKLFEFYIASAPKTLKSTQNVQ
jgi:hypothetical protein